jgi:hypothetical protein
VGQPKPHYDAEDNDFIMDVRRKLWSLWQQVSSNETAM